MLAPAKYGMTIQWPHALRLLVDKRRSADTAVSAGVNIAGSAAMKYLLRWIWNRDFLLVAEDEILVRHDKLT